MYEEFFELKSRPFQMIPDPAFLFWSDTHLMAFTMMRYGILNAAPLTVITGDVGTGKTTLLRQLLGEFPAELVIGLISNMQAGKGELLEWALMAFEQPYDGSHVERFRRFQQFIVDTYAAGKQVVLIIDEAQNLGIEQLEELRMLSNVNADADQLLQIILVGQPELRELLRRPELRQFSQRITSDFNLSSLESHEVYSYIQRRLVVSGMDPEREIFPQKTCDLIMHATGGVPRLINVLCDLCMVCAYAADRDVIDEDILREIMTDIERNGTFNQFAPLSGPPKLVATSDEDAAKPTAKPTQR